MNKVASAPKPIAPETETSDMRLGRSKTPRGNSIGSSENTSRSAGRTPPARKLRMAEAAASISRNSPIRYISIVLLRVRLELPDRDHREQLGKNHVQHRHGGERRGRDGDLD